MVRRLPLLNRQYFMGENKHGKRKRESEEENHQQERADEGHRKS